MSVAIAGGSRVYSSSSQRIVAHGSNMYAARPVGIQSVIWVGSVTPAFGVVGTDFLDSGSGPVPVAEWLPSLVAGLLWWNPRNAAAFTEIAGQITNWQAENSGPSLTQTASILRPARESGWVRMAGAVPDNRKALDLATGIPDGEAITYIVVADSDSSVNTGQTLVSSSYTAGAGASSAKTNLLTKDTLYTSFRALAARTNGDQVESICGADEDPHIVAFDRHTNTIELLVDDRSCFRYAGCSASPTGHILTQIGALVGDGNSYFIGRIGDIAIKPGGMTRQEIAAVNTYFARHNTIALQTGPVPVSTGLDVYEAWPMLAGTGPRNRTLIAGWSSRSAHAAGPGSRPILRTCENVKALGTAATWSTPINLLDLLPSGTLDPAHDDIVINGLGEDGRPNAAGVMGSIATCWHQSWNTDGSRGPYGPFRFFHRSADRDPALLSSWELAAALDPAYFPLGLPTQINSPRYVPGFGGPGVNRLIAPWNHDGLRNYGYMIANPANLASWDQVLLLDGDTSTYSNEWSYIHVGGGRMMGVGHRFVFWDVPANGGPFPLQTITYDPAVGIGAAGFTAAADTNLVPASRCPAWLTVDPDGLHIECWFANRDTNRVWSSRALISDVFANPLAWSTPVRRWGFSDDGGANGGYPAAVSLGAGLTAAVLYAGHGSQGTTDDIVNRVQVEFAVLPA